MIWFASLDPANFSLNIDTTSIDNGSQSDRWVISTIVNCAFGEIDNFRNNLERIKSQSQREKTVYLASIIWHEQRHFLDLILVNYGNYVFRQYATCYMNIPMILKDVISKGNKIAFPLSIYTDPIRRFQLRQPELSKPVQTIINDLKAREISIAVDRKHIGNSFNEMGAYVHLEALGTIFQIAAIENITPKYAPVLAKKIAQSDPNGRKYSWYNKLQEVFKYPVWRTNSEIDIARIGFLPMILYATLSTRSWSKDIPDAKKYRSDRLFLAPVERLDIILKYLSKRPSIFEPFEFDEVWFKVNEMVRILFGRTIIEEIEVDVGFHEENMVNKANRSSIDPLIKNILNDHLKLRKSLVDLFKSDPALLLHPDRYSQETLGKISPIPVLTFPVGVPDDNLSKSIWKGLNGAIFKKKRGTNIYYYWNAIPKVWNTDNRIAFKNNDDWGKLHGFITPLAKAMLKGRNHRTSIGPEFIVMEEELRLAGLEAIYEPEFKFPQNLSLPASVFYELRNKEKAICDICHKGIDKPDGFVVSPWVFRKNKRIEEYTIQMLGGNAEAERKYAIDWTPWLLCQACHGNFIDAGLIPKSMS